MSHTILNNHHAFEIMVNLGLKVEQFVSDKDPKDGYVEVSIIKDNVMYVSTVLYNDTPNPIQATRLAIFKLGAKLEELK